MENVLMVSETKLKAFTDINENVSVDILLPNIQIAQDIGCQTLLGTKFYNSLRTKIQGQTLNPEETILLEEYIQPYLLHRAYYEALPSIYMRIMNKGIVVGQTEEGNAASVGEMRYLRNIQQNRYEFYSQRLMDYIKANQGYFPDYYTYTTNDGMKPSKENYFSGIQIGPGQRKVIKKKLNIPNNWENFGENPCLDC